MWTCSTYIDYLLLVFLLLLYITSFVIEIIVISKKDKFFYSLLDLIFSFIMVILIVCLGFVSIYFSLGDKICIYIIILLFAFIIKSIHLTFFFLYYKENIIICYIDISQLIINFFNIISSICERNKLNMENEGYPLQYVDDTITEDMYNAIVSQGLNPNDKKLNKELQTKIKLKRETMTKSLNESTSSSRKSDKK